MEVYEHIIMTKKRSNQKKWDIAQREYSTELIALDETPKQTMIVYKWLNAESIDQVKQFNAEHSFIVMATLGQALRVRPLDMPTLLKDAENAPRCSVTGKRIVVAHYAK
jgi:hypothetical protein